MFPAILICALMVKYAAAKDVTVSLGTPKSCFFIGDNVKLLCAVSATYNCCNLSRIWQDNSGTIILADGNTPNASKYEEDYDNGTTGYNLIIKNVQKSDLGLNYKCLYRIKEDVLFLSMDYICSSSEVNISGDCWECAGTDYGWSVIGTAIGAVIIIIAKVIIMKFAKVKKVEPGTVLIVGGLTFLISVVVNIPVALPIGRCVCHCVNGTDPWFIVLGLGTSVITGVIIMKLKQVGKLKTVLIVGGVIVIIVGVLNLFALLIGYYTCHCVGGCWKCAGKGYGWAFLGTVIGTIIIIIAKVKICDTMCAPRDGLLFIIGVVFSAIFAVPIGYCMCQCVDGSDWLLIVSGLGTSLITGVIPIIYKKIKGEDMDFIDECCLVVIISKCAGCLVVIISKYAGSSQGSNGSNEQPLKENKKKKPAAEKSSNEPPLEKKKKKKSAAETGSRSPTTGTKHIKTANNETEMIPTEKGFSGDLEKKRPLPPLTTQLSPTNRPLPLPSSTKPLPSSTRPLPQIMTKKGDN